MRSSCLVPLLIREVREELQTSCFAAFHNEERWIVSSAWPVVDSEFQGKSGGSFLSLLSISFTFLQELSLNENPSTVV